ncbi:hypothetical protein BVX98_00380 [bacterium F11]|nr:hypothetical protein BVX98_00380 [bacterium F11]
MSFTHNSVPYIEKLSKKAKNQSRIDEVKRAIEKTGEWTASEEWRISTVTEMSIKQVEQQGKKWYRVKISCDNEMACHTPTIERAVEFLGIFEVLAQDLFWTIGWPSWKGPKEPGS